MIYQGDNHPIVITLSEPVDQYPCISIGLFQVDMYPAQNHFDCQDEHQDPVMLKHWNKEDLEIDSNIITVPLTQEDTLALPAGSIQLEIKMLDHEGYVKLFQKQYLSVSPRYDQTIMNA